MIALPVPTLLHVCVVRRRKIRMLTVLQIALPRSANCLLMTVSSAPPTERICKAILYLILRFGTNFLVVLKGFHADDTLGRGTQSISMTNAQALCTEAGFYNKEPKSEFSCEPRRE